MSSEPVQIVVSSGRDFAPILSSSASPSPFVPVLASSPSPCPLLDDQTVELLLSKIHKLETAVKYQHEEQNRRHQNIPVTKTTKKVKLFGTPSNPIEIVSYNLWNVNSMWEKRMMHIATMFNASSPDIIGLQEVRTLNRQSRLQLLTPYRMEEDLFIEGTTAMPDHSQTMLKELHRLLPQYRWAIFVPMADFSDGTQEGVAFISKHPIIEASSGELNVVGPYSDRNTRGVLRVRVLLPSDGDLDESPMDLFNTHLTYDDRQQCPMIVKLLEYVDRYYEQDTSIEQIIMGDLNTYLAFEWPVDFMEAPFSPASKNPLNPCVGAFRSWLERNEDDERPYFSDIWDEAFPRKGDGTLLQSKGIRDDMQAMGHTFPVFKDSALTNCRPDRMLRRLNSHTELVTVSTFGDEVWYEENHMNKIEHYLSDHLGVSVILDRSDA